MTDECRVEGEGSFQKSIYDDYEDDLVGDYKDIEGELGGQLGDAIGGQGGEFAGEMVSPPFLPFPCCNGIRCQASRLQGRHHCAVMTKDSHLIDIYTKTYIMA